MTNSEKEVINKLITACLQAFASDKFEDKAKAIRELGKIKDELLTVSTSSTTTVINS